MSNNPKTLTTAFTPRQSSFIRAYSEPSSPTFSNCYQSARSSGYSDLTARNLTHVRPKWLSDLFGQMTVIDPKQITQALTGVIYSESEPTVIKLRALELMMRYYSMFKQNEVATSVSISLDLTGGSSGVSPPSN